jgi:hypothetical protein
MIELKSATFALETAMHQIIRIVASLILLASTANFGLAAELGVPVQPE